MPRFATTSSMGASFDGTAVLALQPTASTSFSVLSLEVCFFYVATLKSTAEQGVLAIARATTVGLTPSTRTAVPCDPGSAAALTIPRWNYVTPPAFSAATTFEKICCPTRVAQYRFWEEGELVVDGAAGLPLVFATNSGASMPPSSNFRVTVEWVE